MDDFLRIENLACWLGGRTVLDGIHLSIRRGEIFSLLGPSGCGKTTLLRLLAGFLQPGQGRILLEGRDLTALPPERRPVNTVFQNYALFPHLSVERNIAFGLECGRLPRSEMNRRVRRLLELARLEDCARRRPGELSGGQKQRVALARALAREPAVLLLDEPLAALDLQLRQTLLDELQSLQRQLGTTFIYVTHDQTEAMRVSDRMAVMNGGRLAQVDAPQAVYEQPADTFVARFIGEGNLLAACCRARDQNGRLELSTADGQTLYALAPADWAPLPGQACHVLIRPEHLHLVQDTQPSPHASHPIMLNGRVLASRALGPRARIEVRVQDTAWMADLGLASGAPPIPPPNTPVRLFIDPAHVRVLP